MGGSPDDVNENKNGAKAVMDTRTGEATGRAEGHLGREVQSKIGQQLRAMYDEVVREGVPDRFADLLRRLDSGGSEGPHS